MIEKGAVALIVGAGEGLSASLARKLAAAGAAVALGAVAPPLAWVPFLDPGKKEDADCNKLLADAKIEGAVKKVAAKDDPAEQKKAAEGKPTVPQKKTTTAKGQSGETKPQG